MIATVTLNPAIDHNIEVDEIKFDDVTKIRSSFMQPGGKGINVSRVINILGGPTVAYGFIAGREGGQLSMLLAEEGVLNSFIAVKGGSTRVNVIVTERSTGRQIRMNGEGPRVEVEELELLKDRLLRFGKGGSCAVSFMVFAGSIPPGLTKNVYNYLIEEVQSIGIRCVLDADGEALKYGVKAKPFMIKPNTYELERLLDRKVEKDEDVVDYAKRIVDMGVEIVAVTRGGKKAYLVGRDFVFEGIPPKIKVVSAVGSGDSFIGAFLYAIYLGKTLEEAFKWGMAAGAATAMVHGTGLMTLELFEEMLPQVVVNRIE